MFLDDFDGDGSSDALCVPEMGRRSLATGDAAGTFLVCVHFYTCRTLHINHWYHFISNSGTIPYLSFYDRLQLVTQTLKGSAMEQRT